MTTTRTPVTAAWFPHTVRVASVVTGGDYTTRRGLCGQCGAMVELVAGPLGFWPAAPSTCAPVE